MAEADYGPLSPSLPTSPTSDGQGSGTDAGRVGTATVLSVPVSDAVVCPSPTLQLAGVTVKDYISEGGRAEWERHDGRERSLSQRGRGGAGGGTSPTPSPSPEVGGAADAPGASQVRGGEVDGDGRGVGGLGGRVWSFHGSAGPAGLGGGDGVAGGSSGGHQSRSNARSLVTAFDSSDARRSRSVGADAMSRGRMDGVHKPIARGGGRALDREKFRKHRVSPMNMVISGEGNQQAPSGLWSIYSISAACFNRA